MRPIHFGLNSDHFVSGGFMFRAASLRLGFAIQAQTINAANHDFMDPRASFLSRFRVLSFSGSYSGPYPHSLWA